MVGKPAMPEDRLMVSNVSKTGCRVSWQAPKDNGGLPIEYIIEKFTAQSDSWAIHVRFFFKISFYLGTYSSLIVLFVFYLGCHHWNSL